jgi:hypothetical protein
LAFSPVTKINITVEMSRIIFQIITARAETMPTLETGFL